eukprot:TRINITY_DN28836_c0_g3_i4.p3 TRINITY_DN28836_c0_g3~~TRINITY_DN28836_c0_g3_i4.p3  ORF type:complete len:107 (-),score=17.66 TRINITY_DN28836_c0_g3_i4:63-383(-)
MNNKMQMLAFCCCGVVGMLGGEGTKVQRGGGYLLVLFGMLVLCSALYEQQNVNVGVLLLWSGRYVGRRRDEGIKRGWISIGFVIFLQLQYRINWFEGNFTIVSQCL